jgi:hypothetical protein
MVYGSSAGFRRVFLAYGVSVKQFMFEWNLMLQQHELANDPPKPNKQVQQVHRGRCIQGQMQYHVRAKSMHQFADTTLTLRTVGRTLGIVEDGLNFI